MQWADSCHTHTTIVTEMYPKLVKTNMQWADSCHTHTTTELQKCTQSIHRIQQKCSGRIPVIQLLSYTNVHKRADSSQKVHIRIYTENGVVYNNCDKVNTPKQHKAEWADSCHTGSFGRGDKKESLCFAATFIKHIHMHPVTSSIACCLTANFYHSWNHLA